MGLPRGNARVRNWVNSGKPKRAGFARMAILSQAAEGTRSVAKVPTRSQVPRKVQRLAG
jgi:hypothetical protein